MPVKIDINTYKRVMRKYNKFRELQDVKRAKEEIDILIEEDQWQDAGAIMAILSQNYVVYKKPNLDEFLRGLKWVISVM